MKNRSLFCGSFLLLSALSLSSARAEAPMPVATAAVVTPTYTFGARIGGYGFREHTDAAHNPWTDCRMNGLGVFAERAFGRVAFVEAGVDFYFAESWPFKPAAGETEMDRVSTLTSFAGGLRMFGGKLVSPYVQLGAALEVTRVTMDHGGDVAPVHGTFVLPVGFLSIGGDLNIGAHLSAGLDLRALLMGHFDHETADATALRPELGMAAQMQFYAKYRL